MSLLFVPVSADQLRTWAGVGVLPAGAVGYAVTPGLCAAFEVSDDEEAEQIAMVVASIASLATYGRRLVVVAAGVGVPKGDADFGEVQLPQLRYQDVASIFADEPGQELVAVAAKAAAGQPLSTAWDQPEVTALLANTDLLWHGAGEWAALVTD
jgi:hypothetical protein